MGMEMKKKQKKKLKSLCKKIINNYELGVVFATKDMPFAVPYRYPPKPYKDTGSTPYLASFQRDHGARGSKAEDDAAGFENI